MKRGRKQKPIEQKIAEGNPGRRKLNTRAPKFDPALPLPRFDLGPEGVTSWKERVGQLAPAGVLQPTDHVGLTVLVAWEGVLAKHMAGIEDMELTQEGESSSQVNAEIRARLAITKEFRLWLQIYGLTPSARADITVPPGKDTDLLAEEQAAQPLRLVKGGKA